MRDRKAMRLLSIATILLLSALPCAVWAQQDPYDQKVARDTFWGVEISDPFRWLEFLRSDATAGWLKAQEKLCRAEKAKFQGTYLKIGDKMYTHGPASVPRNIRKGALYFRYYYHNEYSAPVLHYSTADETEIMKDIAYDPNYEYSKEPILINDFYPSNDSRYLAVALSKAGSDWVTIKVRDLYVGRNLDDRIDWVKFSDVIWTDEGFFYSRFKEPPSGQAYVARNKSQILYYHRLGDPQEKDIPIYAPPQQGSGILKFELTSDKRFLILYSSMKSGDEWNRIVGYKDLRKGPDSEFKLLISTPDKKKYQFSIVDAVGDRFIIKTNFDAPRYRVMTCHKDSLNRISPLIPEFDKNLESAYYFGGKLVAEYSNGRATTLFFHDIKGNPLKALEFPEGVAVKILRGGPTASTMNYSINYFYTPPIIFSLDLNTFSSELVKKTEIHYDAERYTTSIVTFTSKDGTKVPMYLTHRKGLTRSPQNPVLLHGYGGFGVSSTPFYSFSNILLFENDGILAVPMLRGGGDFGDDWHEQGKKLNKQNTFDDFISAAEFLVDSGYTSKARLAIQGASHGGLVVGAALTQRPDLFSVAIAEVGAYDMLRYHLFTTGMLHRAEFGTVHDSIEFHNLLSYSPLHQLKKDIEYPATLVTTSEYDDRLPPFHTYKFLASLQANSKGDKPHILYFEEDAGHSGSEKIMDFYKKEAYILGFMFNQMGIKFKTSF